MKKLLLPGLALALTALALAPPGAAVAAPAATPAPAEASAPTNGYLTTVPGPARQGQLERPAADASARPSAALPAPAPPCSGVCGTTNFTTLKEADNGKVLSPGDPSGGAGLNHVFAAINVVYGLYGLGGGAEIGPKKLKSLYPRVPGTVFDPKVTYDEFNNEYILVFLSAKAKSSKSNIYVTTVPDATAIDQSTWCSRKIKGDQLHDGIKQMADYPGLGYDGSHVYVTTNVFGFTKGYYGTQIIAFDNAGLYDCNQPLSFTTFSGKQTREPGGRKSASIQPATTGGSTPPGSEYLMSSSIRCSSQTCWSDELMVWRIRDKGGSLHLARTAVPITRAKLPYFGTQLGGSAGNPNTFWDTGDLRLTNVFYDVTQNALYTAHAVNYNIGGGYDEATSRWYEVQPAGALKSSVLTRTGYVGTANLDTGWPAVATDAAGDLFMTTSGAGVDYPAYLSGFAAVVAPSDPSGTVTTPVLMDGAAGNARYEVFAGPERWGDFNAIGRDPSDGTKVWAFNASAHSLFATPTTTNFQETANQLTYVP